MSEADGAIEALRQGDYRRAHHVLAELGAARPGAAARLRLMWALTQLMRGNLRESIEALVEVCGEGMNEGRSAHQQVGRLLGPVSSLLPLQGAQGVRLRLGDYFLRRRNPDEAMPWLRDALEAAPEDPLAVYLEANARAELDGDRRAVQQMEAVLDQAAAEANRAHFIGGGAAILWFRLGVIHDRFKNPERAARYLDEAVELSRLPQAAAYNAAARVALGGVLVRLGRFEEALAVLEAVPPDAGNYPYAIRLRATAWAKLGDSETALALLQQAAEIDPLGAVIFLEMGRVHLADDNLAEAEATLARAFRTNPKLSALTSAIGALERRLGRTMDPDAGLPPAHEFDIPEEFRLRLDGTEPSPEAGLCAGAVSWFRVVGTIMVREVLHQSRRSGVGYLAAIAEPLMMIVAMGLVYHLEDRRMTHGISVPAHLTAAVGTYWFFFMYVMQAVSGAIKTNVNLLYFRTVTPVALIAAGAARQFLTGLVGLSAMIAGLSLYEGSVQVADPLMLLASVAGISALATIFGVIFGVGNLVIPSLHLVEIFFKRFMLFFSGIFFFANDLNPWLRHWALYNPVLHLFEFVRESMFLTYRSLDAVWSYPLLFILVGTLTILVVERAARRYVLAPS